MKPSKLGLSVWIWLLTCAIGAQCQLLVFPPSSSNYKLADTSTAPEIQVASNDFAGVKRTANDLAVDFGRVVGVNGTVRTHSSLSASSGGRPIIIAGTIGSSSLIDSLISSGKINPSQTKGKWESYTSQLVQNPTSGVSWALVIAGSDKRGTIYGLYDISETIGVSPWYWWADVPAKTKEAIYVQTTPKIQGPPSVKYRGFFINDEAPALTTWASKNFPASSHGGHFVSEFYKHVFELTLRLRANYHWPAMWGRMFYVDDSQNGPLADEYGVVMGTSHHEPMARSDSEQTRYLVGNWDWSANQQNVVNFMREGPKRARNWETMYTMGMRGKGDAASPTLTAESLEEIIQVQQNLLREELGIGDLSTVPQTWVLYKVSG